ncbi:MAG TPA: hypothetical protein VNT26_05355, partial [Candidatus Sulfotelmatobacter sp.]|nr:hypothetical protein [Candidatus Sulfotelmatobacter sp.]
DPDAVFLPSKLLEYLSTDRIILAITTPGSPTAELLQPLSNSTVVSAHNPEEIACGMANAVRMRRCPDIFAERQQRLQWLMPQKVIPELVSYLIRIARRGRNSQAK